MFDCGLLGVSISPSYRRFDSARSSSRIVLAMIGTSLSTNLYTRQSNEDVEKHISLGRRLTESDGHPEKRCEAFAVREEFHLVRGQLSVASSGLR
jgi:hypothetical protein